MLESEFQRLFEVVDGKVTLVETQVDVPNVPIRPSQQSKE